MLVLSRKLNETIVIDGDIRITVVGIRGKHVQLGIEAPGSVGIYREELLVSAGTGAESPRPASALRPAPRNPGGSMG
jgi:carbon storage regulator